MNRRIANPAGPVPGRVVTNWQGRMRTGEAGTQTEIPTVKETIKRLSSHVEALEKKVAFLQKTDLSTLKDESGHGHVSFIMKDGSVIMAHRFILASKSPVFKIMLDTNMTENNFGTIRVEDIDAPVLQGLIEYFYTAEVKFTHEASAADLFKAAHKYDVPELQAECEAELLSSVTEHNLAEMLQIASRYNLKSLFKKAVAILKDKFDEVHEKVLNDLLS